jgi:hypothetical protein
VDESKLRNSKASASARLASIRRLDAVASSTRESVDHLAAAYPDHAASQRYDREQHGLGDGDEPVAPLAQVGVLRVLADLFPDLARRKPLRHGGSLTP